MDVRDVMNPPGMFDRGKRLQEYSAKDILPLSGKLIPEFDRRQNIREMFTRKPSLSVEKRIKSDTRKQAEVKDMVARSTDRMLDTPMADRAAISPDRKRTSSHVSDSTNNSEVMSRSPVSSTFTKQPISEKSTPRTFKRAKSANKAQQSLKGFFKPNTAALLENASNANPGPLPIDESPTMPLPLPISRARTEDLGGSYARIGDTTARSPSSKPQNEGIDGALPASQPISTPGEVHGDSGQFKTVHDPIESKESWSKLFAKPVPPRCEAHNEPCITLLTKKTGMNCGRSFWMCARPLGPTGAKEKNTEWQCQTFIWCSNWNRQE